MSRQAKYFRIGLFVICALSLLFAGLVVLGSRALNSKAIHFETYFDGTVQGLDVGAPVKLRGVKIGSVEKIAFADSVYPTESRYVMVRVAVPIEKEIGQEQKDEFEEWINKNIEAGLRVRLAAQGLTGASYLEADYLDPRRFPPLAIDWTPKTRYVPSAPSMLSTLSDSLQKILIKFERTRIDEVSVEVHDLLVNLNGIMTNDIAPALQNVDVATRVVTEAVSNLAASASVLLDERVAPILANVETASNDLPETLARLNRTLKRIEYAIGRFGNGAKTVALEGEIALLVNVPTCEDLISVELEVNHWPLQIGHFRGC